MADALYLFSVCTDKVKHKLHSFLKDGSSYITYVLNNQDLFYEEVCSEVVLDKLQSDIETLSREELWSIILYFFDNEHKDDDTLDRMLMENGMEMIYEITEKSEVRYFLNTLIDYETYVDATLEFQCQAKFFKEFLDYALCFTGALLLHIENAEGRDQNLSVNKSELQLRSERHQNWAFEKIDILKKNSSAQTDWYDTHKGWASLYGLFLELEKIIASETGMIAWLHAY